MLEDSDVNDDKNFVRSWDHNELMRWYKRGKEKMLKQLRIETLINKVNNQDIYAKEMMEVNLAEMFRIKYNHRRVIGIDSDSSGRDTDEEDKANADDDCEHAYCHRVHCKIDPDRSAHFVDNSLK